MCCITTIILFLASRIAIVVYWLSDRQIFNRAFKNIVLPINLTIPVWIWALLGFILLPWTTLAYLYLFPGGIAGYKWIILVGAFILDLVSHGGSYHHRNRLAL